MLVEHHPGSSLQPVAYCVCSPADLPLHQTPVRRQALTAYSDRAGKQLPIDIEISIEIASEVASGDSNKVSSGVSSETSSEVTIEVAIEVTILGSSRCLQRKSAEPLSLATHSIGRKPLQTKLVHFARQSS